MEPPVARVAPVRDTHFGVSIDDPYRWMEDESAEFQSWVDGQAGYAREVLDALPLRDALLKRIRQLRGTTSERFGFVHAGGRAFLFRQEPDQSLPVLVTAAGDGVVKDIDRVLLDPTTSDDGGGPHSSLDWFVPSPDGRYVACGISRGGNEFRTLRVIDMSTGDLLDDAVPNLRPPFVSWLDGNASFTYFRFPELPPDTPPDQRRLDSQTALHRLGDDPAQDQIVLARGLNPRLPLSPLDRPHLVRRPGSPWLLAVVVHTATIGTTDEGLSDCSLFVAPLATLADPASIPWVPVAEPADGVVAYAIGPDTLYLVARGAAPMGRVLAVPFADPVLSRATVLVPEGDREIEAIRRTDTHLLIRESELGQGRLRRIPLGGGAPEEVSLPVDGTITEWSDPLPDGSVLLRIESWTTAPHVYRYGADGTVTDAGGPSATAEEYADIAAYQVTVPARDGTPIPVTVLHRRELTRDGARPTILACYGSYGISFSPSYHAGRLAWLERGGVYVVAHVRGGGEHGPPWHQAGRKLRKENTINDFIDCAEYLVAERFTTPTRLIGWGGSAGGIPTGGALVRRPDLWAVMVMLVPVTNTLRVEFSENGPINVPEMGSVSTEDGLRGLLIADALHRVVDGTPYPAVLLTAGRNDSRVALWQPGKMTARLQSATSSGRPVVLRVEEHGGHGFGSTTDQREAALADEYAFLLHHTGSP